jgi:Coenzyme PQQ synthesis protein D (PqqD)
LNRTGLEILESMDQYPAIEAIARQLPVQYEADLPHATASTERIVRKLVDERLIYEEEICTGIEKSPAK